MFSIKLVLIHIDYVGFSQPIYTVYEDEGPVKIVVEIQSNKTALTDIVMQVKEMSNTAGELRIILVLNVILYCMCSMTMQCCACDPCTLAYEW